MEKIEKLVFATKLMERHLDSLVLAINMDNIILSQHEHLNHRVDMIHMSIAKNKKDLIKLVGEDEANRLLTED